MANPASGITRYLGELDALYRSGRATEHSYRPALKALFEHIARHAGAPELAVINEPKHIACGAPDYIITKHGIPVGYIEAKDIPVDLDNTANKEQFDRYKRSLGNLIITNYLEFRLFAEGELRASASLAAERGGSIIPDAKQFPAFLALAERFTAYSGAAIRGSERLAKIMAGKAKLLAEIIAAALKEKTDHDTLSDQYQGFKNILLHSLSIDAFADIYAQTLAYGLFAARLNQNDSRQFTRALAPYLIPRSNPFLRKFFNYAAGINLDTRIVWIVDALADLFNRVAVEDLRKEFDKAAQDPYIHFYEAFLAAYDPALRKTRGVYYTPAPVVQFIVRAVDDILKTEFHVPKGLADCSKVKRAVSGKHDEPASTALHKVQILDPSAGTGTFLAEVIDAIYASFSKNRGAWPDYCGKHLIPRINGFEILMAPYAMAHFKLGMKLKETGYTFTDDSRLRVYLANTLEEPPREAPELFMEKWLAEEANEANGIKTKTPVMVVLGNPPYSGESANITADDFLAPYKTEPGGVEKLQERNSKWLNDDYVKFIRFGQNCIEKYGEGVLAYINNHSFLDNPTFRGMRWNLLNSFDKIYILDLHGNAKKKETAPDGSKDENVFDIQAGVSINLFIKTGGKKKKDELAAVYHCDMYGERETKYAYLSENTLSTINWKTVPLEGPHYFFTEKDFGNKTVYEEGFIVTELFTANSAGIVTARDDFTIHKTEEALKETVIKFLSLDNEAARVKFNLGKDVRDWSVAGARKDLVPNPEKNPHPDFDTIIKISYRPFDIRYTYYTGHSKGFHCMPRGEVMRHFIIGENIGLVTVKRQPLQNPASYYFVSHHIISNGYIRSDSVSIDTVFPLYLYPDEDSFDKDEARRPNLNPSIVNEIAEKTGLSFTIEKQNNETTFAPIDILDYIYAVLYSNNYRRTYREFLKIDFPRIPYPENADQFRKLASIGSLLRGLHVMENVSPSMDTADFPIAGTNKVETLRYHEEKVYINKQQYFENVPLETWGYYIGGYQPAQKWLKDRKGRVLSFEDIEHYQNIITVLAMTITLQARIDGEFFMAEKA